MNEYTLCPKQKPLKAFEVCAYNAGNEIVYHTILSATGEEEAKTEAKHNFDESAKFYNWEDNSSNYRWGAKKAYGN